MIKIKLSDVLDVKRGASISGEYYATEGDLIRLTLGNFDYPGGGFKPNTTKDDIYYVGPVRDEFIMKEGDIITPLTEQVRGLLGETAIIPESGKYIQNGDVGKIIPYEDVLDKSFAAYLISSPVVKAQLDATAQQTKIRHTSPDKIKDCTAWIPELSEQKKIGKLMDDINVKIKANNRINSELESMAKTIYDYWFLQFEFPNEEGKPYKSSGGKMVWNDELKREIPEGWEVKGISEIASLYQPKTISGDEILQNGKYLVYGANGIVGTYNEYNHENNEIAICCRGASCGDYLMTLPKSWITGNAMVVNISDAKLKEFVFYGLSKEGIAPFISGSAQPQITRTNLENMKMIMPAYELIDKFGKMSVSYRKQIENNAFQCQELASLRDFLLPMLMNGQVTFKEKA